MQVPSDFLMRSLKSAGIQITIAAVMCLPVGANGLGENKPWKFTRKDKVRLLELQLLKESGCYDSQKGAGGTAAGDTIINGDQINCIVQSSATANSNTSGLEGTTGSLNGISDSDITADTAANESESWHDGDGSLDIGQENSGELDSSVSDSDISSSVGSFTGGGTTNQTVDNNQSADGSTNTSTVENVTVCDGMTVN